MNSLLNEGRLETQSRIATLGFLTQISSICQTQRFQTPTRLYFRDISLITRSLRSRTYEKPYMKNFH